MPATQTMPDALQAPALVQLDRHIVDMVANDRVPVPPYPAVAARLTQLARSQNWTASQIAAIVRVDQVLTATVLRHANNVIRRAHGHVTSIEAAITRIGAEELIQIAITFGLGQVLARVGPLHSLRREVWRHATFAAEVCRTLAPRRRLEPGAAFLSGLLHDFGKVIAISCIEELLAGQNAVSPLTPEAWHCFVERYHIELGFVMATKWELPPIIGETIYTHHTPAMSQAFRPYVDAIGVADRLVALVSEQPAVTLEQLAAVPGIRDATEATLLLRLLPNVAETIHGFEPPPPATATPQEDALIARPATTLCGAERPLAARIRIQHGRANDIYEALAITPSGLRMRGSAPLTEQSLVRANITAGGLTLDLWVTVTACINDAGVRRVELKPLTLQGDVRSGWLRLLELAGHQGVMPPPLPAKR